MTVKGSIVKRFMIAIEHPSILERWMKYCDSVGYPYDSETAIANLLNCWNETRQSNEKKAK